MTFLENVRKYQTDQINRLVKFLYDNDKEALKEFLLAAKIEHKPTKEVIFNFESGEYTVK